MSFFKRKYLENPKVKWDPDPDQDPDQDSV